MAISDWMPTLITKLGAITGLAANGTQPHRVRSYADLPASLMELPTLIVLPLRATHQYSAGGPITWVHELQATLYVAGGVLPEAFEQALPYIKLVRDKMAANAQLGSLQWSGGKVDHWGPLKDAPFYEGPGRVTFAGVDNTEREYLGIIFHMELKESETGLTVTA